MSHIVVRMESNQVRVQDTKQDFSTDGKDTVHFAAGKGRMQEKAQLNIFAPQLRVGCPRRIKCITSSLRNQSQ